MFEKKEFVSVVDWVVEQIINSILKGDLKPGDRLPSESELVEQMGVGRNSVREACKILAAYGIIQQRRTEGNYIQSQFTPKLLNPMLYGLILNGSSNPELQALRTILENGIMHLAIANATDEDIQAVQESMVLQAQRVQDSTLTPEEMTTLDIDFHEKLCRCAHNALLSQLFSIINQVMLASRLETHTRLMKSNKNEYTLQAHQKLYDVLLRRADDEADEAVAFSHLEWDHTLAQQ